MSTMCFDLRRVDDDYVCIYRAANNEFSFSKHLAQSSWSDRHPEDQDKKYDYNYIITAKDIELGDIETILFSCYDRNHALDVFEEYRKGGTYLTENKKLHDFNFIRIPLVKYTHRRKITLSNGKKITIYDHDINILHKDIKLYCPINLNKKYKVYGTYSNKDKQKGGKYWQGPRRLRG